MKDKKLPDAELPEIHKAAAVDGVLPAATLRACYEGELPPVIRKRFEDAGRLPKQS